jgi:SCY1-like protein 2
MLTKTEILPILLLGLESSTHSIVDKSLGCLPTVVRILDFSTIKNELFPVVASVFSKTSSLAIKIRGLEAFGILCGAPEINKMETGDGLDGADLSSKPAKLSNAAVLDKYTVQEKVVPLLKAIKTKEPAVMMAALTVFKQIGKMVDAEFLAMDILPLLWSFSLGPLLNLGQFQDYMKVIKALSSRIEQEQTRKLSELASNLNSSSGSLRATDPMNFGNTNGVHGSNDAGEVGLNDFERLVLGKSAAKEDDMLGSSSRPAPQRAQSTPSETPVFAWSTLAPNSSSNSTSRAITPDQTFDAIAALNPSSRGQSAGSSSTLNSLSTLSSLQPTMTPMQPNFTPMQPTLTPTQPNFTPLQPSSTSSAPWSQGSTSFSTITPARKIQPGAAFSIPPPPMGASSISTFSIAPPPKHPVLPTGQTNYGQGLMALGNASQNPPTVNRPKQKTGLDAFESLL